MRAYESWAKLAAWTLVALIAFATLGPLDDRPHLTRDPQVERTLAYVALGFAFALAYPRRPLAVALGVAASVAGLEWAQHLAPGRHAHLRDAGAKALGAGVGLGGGFLVRLCLDWAVPTRRRRRVSEERGRPHARSARPGPPRPGASAATGGRGPPARAR